jgi:DNA polymerase III alpha subunit
MVAKVKINEYGDCVYTEDDLLELIYNNPDLDISKLYIESTDEYNSAVNHLGLDFPLLQSLPMNRISINEFDRTNVDQWYMPTQYQTINVREWLLEKCGNGQEKQRVEAEMQLFETKGFIKVLQFLIYFIDTLRANNVLWGVGRGSSVSSFCLFLIGVHKINPLVYDLDYREFLR